jgi:hypothetical protein
MNVQPARGHLFRATALFCLAFAWTAANSGPAQTMGKTKMQLTSTAFTEGQPIPADYTCEGKNVSPPLQWSGAPASTKSLALIVDDPDAPVGTWVHWVLYNLPAGANQLPENASRTPSATGSAAQGLNDFKRSGYSGPCPPPGKPHRYFFKLYALDIELQLKRDPTKKDVEKAMQGHILAEGRLVGTYQRK